MKLGTHIPGHERRKHIDIEDRRTKVKVTTSKNRERKKDTFFVSARYIKNGISDLIKGNNKITELRTIFQRESKNS